jgi:hypothetical protein
MNFLYIALLLLLLLLSGEVTSGSGTQSKSGKVASAKVTIEKSQQHILHFEFCSS